VANGNRTIEGGGNLEVAKIQQRLDSRYPELIGFAGALRQVGLKVVAAVDRKDVAAMTDVGGELDEVCEACHKVFWYPDDTGTYNSTGTSQGANKGRIE